MLNELEFGANASSFTSVEAGDASQAIAALPVQGVHSNAQDVSFYAQDTPLTQTYEWTAAHLPDCCRAAMPLGDNPALSLSEWSSEGLMS